MNELDGIMAKALLGLESGLTEEDFAWLLVLLRKICMFDRNIGATFRFRRRLGVSAHWCECSLR